MELGRVPAQPHPRSPALNSVIEGSGILTRGWRLRLWAPFSLSSDFSSFALRLFFRESLGRSLFPGRPFCPSHPGLPCYPGILGLRAGATSRRPSWERDDGMFYPSPLQGRLPSDQERSRGATPLIREATTRRCRAGFRRRLQFLSQRPQGLALGTGKP
jgi:hypothetical protein